MIDAELAGRTVVFITHRQAGSPGPGRRSLVLDRGRLSSCAEATAGADRPGGLAVAP